MLARRALPGFRTFALAPLRSYAKAYAPSQNSPNAHIVAHLVRCVEEELAQPSPNKFRIKSLRTGIRIIDGLGWKLESGAQAKEIQGIGDGIARRVEDALQAAPGSSDRPDEPKSAASTFLSTLALLQSLPGIGPSRARMLASEPHNCTTLSDLRRLEIWKLLTQAQRTAVDFREKGVKERIPREAIVEVERKVKGALRELDPEWEVLVGGSYRRLSPTSSDIDLLLFHPSHTAAVEPRSKEDPLRLVLDALKEADVWAGSLSEGKNKAMGYCQLSATAPSDAEPQSEAEKPFGRMDVNLVPLSARPAALLAFTGDTSYNQHIRNLARERGLRLNEHGLWELDPETGKPTARIPTPSAENGSIEDAERGLLEVLGDVWMSPEDRRWNEIARLKVEKDRGEGVGKAGKGKGKGKGKKKGEANEEP